MKTRRIGAVLALATAIASPTVEATIDKLESSCGIAASGSIPLVRGFLNDITISGVGVDLATSVTTTLPGVPITVVSRKNGFGSNIVVRLAPPSAGGRAGGTVTLNYFGGGTDSFGVSVNATPTVSSIEIVPGSGVSTSGGITRVTSLDTHVLALKGTNLDSLNPADLECCSGLQNTHTVLRIPSELRISFASSAGPGRILSPFFVVDQANLPNCRQDPPTFTFLITVFDPPRTPTPTPTPNRACLDQKSRETAQLAADAARCGDTPACVQIRKNEQKAIEDRYLSCLARGGK